MHRPLSPTALAFADTLRDHATAAHKDIVHVLPELGALSRGLTVDDAIELGFWKNRADRAGGCEMATGDPRQPFGLLGLSLSPGRGRVALGWAHGPGNPRLWIDGLEVPLPCAADGQPRSVGPGGWCGDRFYCLQVTVEGPALQNWQPLPGSRLALWLWDAERSQALPLEPQPSEIWPSPWVRWLEEDGHRIQIFADRSLHGATPVRTIPV